MKSVSEVINPNLSEGCVSFCRVNNKNGGAHFENCPADVILYQLGYGKYVFY
jgi:hypothetical protein